MELGKVEKLSVRDQWKNEEYDFTPWLAKEENIQLLGDEINLDLEVEGVEIAIGSYKADIVARDGNNRTVIIENQLEKTDHKHLGQIITYASGVEAQIIVWVCSQVTDEHRQAIDWLNEVTRADIAFFACEIELWRIGDSVAAPKFNVVASPSDWTKVVKSTVNSKELSDTKRAHLDFWNGFKSYMEETGTSLKLRSNFANPDPNTDIPWPWTAPSFIFHSPPTLNLNRSAARYIFAVMKLKKLSPKIRALNF